MQSCWIWKVCHCTLANHKDDFNMKWRQISQQISVLGAYSFIQCCNTCIFLTCKLKETGLSANSNELFMLRVCRRWLFGDSGKLTHWIYSMQVCISLWIIAKIKTREMCVWAKFAKISSRENFYLYSIHVIHIQSLTLKKGTLLCEFLDVPDTLSCHKSDPLGLVPET